MREDKPVVVSKFPAIYVKTFKKLPPYKTERTQLVNREFRTIIKKKKIPKKILPKNYDSMIFLGYRGSIAHGMSVLNSDIDLIGTFVNSIEYYTGLGSNDLAHVAVQNGKWDMACFEFRRLIQLLSKGDINIFPYLFLPSEHIIYASQEWKRLQANKRHFKSYAFPSKVYEFASSRMNKLLSINSNRATERQKKKFKRHGYDTITSSHILRFLNMATEYMHTGDMFVDRVNKDIGFLLRVKNGFYELDKVKEEMQKLLKQLKDQIRKTDLEPYPNGGKIDKLLTSIILKFNDKRKK